MNRRTFLVASTLGFAGFNFGSPARAARKSTPRSKHAKSAILFFLCGGASHIDTWDMKPDAPEEYRGPFKPTDTSAPGVQLCEHLPLLAKQAHQLAIIRSLGHYRRGTGDHHAGYYYNLTGHAPDQTFRTLGNNRRPYADDWPYLGTVVASRRDPHPYLPNAVTLPHKPSRLPYTRPGQFAARLGVEHDPIYLQGSHERPLEFRAPSITLQSDTSLSRLQSRRGLLHAVDDARRDLENSSAVDLYSKQQKRAMSLLASTRATQAFDLTKEPLPVRERYGKTANAMSLLLARRLVEAEVPFVTVFWYENPKLKSKCRSAGGWDTHGNNFNCLKDGLLPEFDQCFSALIEDLAQRGMLDETLLIVNSEMGRKPLIGDRRSGGVKGAGRDHWTNAMSVLMAGGGIRGGQTHGTTDKRAEYPDQQKVAPEDVTHTIYHAMGIDDLEAHDTEGRPYSLLAEGEPILSLF